MKSIKGIRIISLLLAVLMVLSVTGVFSAYGAEDSLLSKDIDFLQSIGILDQTEKTADDFITREEFGAALINMFVKSGYITSADFVKIKGENTWETKHLLNNLGYDVSDSSEYVSFSEVVCSIVNGLGYRFRANQKGGYPTGYHLTAAGIGMLKGNISAGPGDLMKRGTTARIIKNSLKIEISDDDIVTYGNTIMSNMSLKEGRGIVAFNGVTAVDMADLKIDAGTVLMSSSGGQKTKLKSGISGEIGRAHV